MICLTTFAAAVILTTVTIAADTVETDSSSCLIKGADGDYNYDPTSGKGPADWGTLKPEYKVCRTGKVQSPIDMPTDVNYLPLSKGPMPKLRNTKFEFKASTSNWALSCPEGRICGITTFMGKTFKHINTHFHAPSENFLNGVQYPLEVHMVHQADDGALAVVATMFQYPPDDDYPAIIATGGKKDFGVNTFFKEILTGVTSDKKSFRVDAPAVIDRKKGYCTFAGSLTTPPCSEGVTWIMSMNIETVSRRQVFEYSVTAGASFDGNDRPIQPRNGREITCYV